jgi:hypothetical protein
MKNGIINIVQDYFDFRKSGKINDDTFKLRLKDIGVDDEKISDILLKMDDEWTIEQIYLLEIKTAKYKYYFGYGITIILLLLSFLSFFELLFQGKIQLLIFSASALITGMFGKSSYKQVKMIRKNRQSIWLSWLSGKINKPFNIKKISK